MGHSCEERARLGIAFSFRTNMELSCAVAVMDKNNGWEERKEEENQIGARFGAGMWIKNQSSNIATAKRREQLHVQLHSITEVVNKTWDFLYRTHQRIEVRGTPRKQNCVVLAI